MPARDDPYSEDMSLDPSQSQPQPGDRLLDEELERRLNDPEFPVRLSVVGHVAGRRDATARHVQYRLLRDKDEAAIEAMAEALVRMADVDAMMLLCEALFFHDADMSPALYILWSLKMAADRDRFDVEALLREVADTSIIAAREGAEEALEWLGLLSAEEIALLQPFDGGYTLSINGLDREIRMVEDNPEVLLGDPPFLLARGFRDPERGYVQLVESNPPAHAEVRGGTPHEEWILGTAMITFEKTSVEQVSRNYTYRLADERDVISGEVDWSFRTEWRIQTASSGERVLECRETSVRVEPSPEENASNLVEKVEVLQRGEHAPTVVSSTSRSLGPTPTLDRHPPVRDRAAGELSGLFPVAPLDDL